MKIKTSDLLPPALNWAVCKALGHHQHPYDEFTPVWLSQRRYSEDWALAGPIIEREGISINRVTDALWVATRQEGSSISEKDGPTPLIAAMRCFVASQLGGEITDKEIVFLAEHEAMHSEYLKKYKGEAK